MRSIAVRAWDKLANDWRYFTIPSLWTDFQNEIYERLVIDGAQFFQFTGLHDKNGKEIYEGDLVAEVDKTEELEKWGKPLTVEFGQFSGDVDTWQIKHGTTGFYLKYNDCDGITGIHNHDLDDHHYGFSCDKLLVVGNIYSNPELLEKKEKQ